MASAFFTTENFAVFWSVDMCFFHKKTYVVAPHYNHLIKGVLMSTHIISYFEDLLKLELSEDLTIAPL